MYQGLGELEAFARDGESSLRFSLPRSSMIAKLMNAELGEFDRVFDVYWKVTRQTLQGVVEQVRTSLAELVGELLATLPPDTDIPSKQATDQAIQYVISGKRHTVNVTTSQAASGGTSTVVLSEHAKADESWWMRWRKRGLLIGLATVVSAGAGVATWLGWAPWW